MADGNDFNGTIIEEFRANAGRVGGPFEGTDMLILHHTGARSGAERATRTGTTTWSPTPTPPSRSAPALRKMPVVVLDPVK